MSAPSDGEYTDGASVWFYDGENALRRQAVLRSQGDVFDLIEDDRTTGPYAFSDLVSIEGPGPRILGMKGRTGWRIGFPDGVPAAIEAALPRPARYGGIVDRFGLWPMSAAFAVVAAIVVVIVLNTPAFVARIFPASIEQRLGDAMVGDFGRRGCTTPAGDRALKMLVERIDPDHRDLEVHVVNVPMVNAVTLPGGRIVIFHGLIRKAASADEVAGVIGHEIGHVHNRDVLESLLRQLGLSVVLGGLDSNVGGYTNALLATAYSRKAEARADEYAITRLRQARVSPVPTAGFFQRLAGKSGRAERMFSYVATHPVSADRATRFRTAANKGATYTAALDAKDWQALQHICDGQKEEKDGFSF